MAGTARALARELASHMYLTCIACRRAKPSGVLSHGRAIRVLGMSLSGMGGMGNWILGSQLAQSTPVPSTWSKELADERRRLVGEGRRFVAEASRQRPGQGFGATAIDSN